ncbi:MAG: pyrroline-5-carboxylate reductase [Candidatus Sumerlaeia bacterium]|nr:pyrroline-5-carboxylate reductase [Candidatus Sumerlaeia bacterium]
MQPADGAPNRTLPPDALPLGFLGAGNMGGALVRGIVASGAAPAADILVHEPRAHIAGSLAAECGAVLAADNREVAARCRTLVLAVKPQHAAAVLDGIAPGVGAGHLLVSICAGLPTAFLEARAPGVRVVRAMPNTPALIGLGATGLCAGRHATARDLTTAWALFEPLGIVEVLGEDQMDTVTALSGSGPAYVFRLIEALVDAAQAEGMPRDVAERLAKRTLLGAATLAERSTRPPAELREAVTSPNGTTAAGLAALEGEGFARAVAACVAAARARGASLAAEAGRPPSA